MGITDQTGSSGVATYKAYDSIPLYFQRVRNGVPVTGLSVTVSVANASTGVSLLASTTLTEVTPGLYSYVWVPGISVQTECVVTYSTGGLQFKENITIDDAIRQLLSEAGRVT